MLRFEAHRLSFILSLERTRRGGVKLGGGNEMIHTYQEGGGGGGRRGRKDPRGYIVRMIEDCDHDKESYHFMSLKKILKKRR